MKKSRFLQAAALAAVVSVASLAGGSAQTTDHQLHGVESEAGKAYMEAMQKMMDAMGSMEMTGDAGVDFAMMMIPHHQSAVAMAEAYLEHGDDPELTELANKVFTDQRREIGILEAWLEAHR